MPPPLSTPELIRTRPTVRVAGRAVDRVPELLLALRMDEQEGGASALELRLSNWASTGNGADLAFGAGSAFELGAELMVAMGDEASPTEIFRGSISALELEFATGQPPELVLLAEDPLQAARLARRSRVFQAQSPRALVSALAAELGLEPRIRDGLDKPVSDWVQMAESNLAFLRRVLHSLDSDLQVVGHELQVALAGSSRRNLVELRLHEQLGRARVRADLADQVSSIGVRGFDPLNGRAVEGIASRGRHLGPGSGQVASGRSRRHEQLAQVTVTTHDEAQLLAQAAFDQRARRFVRLDGTAEGNPLLRVGSHAQVQLPDPRFCNTYRVTRVSHLFDLRLGYRTDFSAECAYLA